MVQQLKPLSCFDDKSHQLPESEAMAATISQPSTVISAIQQSNHHSPQAIAVEQSIRISTSKRTPRGYPVHRCWAFLPRCVPGLVLPTDHAAFGAAGNAAGTAKDQLREQQLGEDPRRVDDQGIQQRLILGMGNHRLVDT